MLALTARRSFATVLLALLAGCSALPAGARQSYLADLFAEVDASVVVLTTTQHQAAPGQPGGEVSFSGLGSGVLIDEEGHIVTAAHVVQTADLVEVEFWDGTTATAAIVSSDPGSDLALLKADSLPETARPATLGDSDNVRVGEDVFVVGAPYGLNGTLTVGHISARHDGDAADVFGMGAKNVELFQTDAAINQGNSGGPMFDMDGNVVGIVSYILSQSGGFEGLGFVVSSNTVRLKMLERPHFWSGITTVPLRGELAKVLNVPQPEGLLVQNVAKGSPGARMGLRPSLFPVSVGSQTILVGGDIILGIGDMPYAAANLDEIAAAIEALGAREKLALRVLREGKIIEIEFFGFHRK